MGAVNIIVVFLYGDEPLPEDKFNLLTSDESDSRSFRSVAKWYKENAQRYNINLNLNIQFSDQQHKVSEDYIIHNYDESLNKNLYTYIIENLPQYLDYNVIVPFYYGSYDFSFVNHVKEKNSFTIFSSQYLPNAFNPDFNDDIFAETFAHELSHLFGAIDKYTRGDPLSPDFEYAKQNGIGCIIESDNPDEKGKDIMCHIMCHTVSFYDESYKEPEWVFMGVPMDQLLVTEITAKEMGWFDLDDDGIIGVEDPCPFSKDNSY